MPTDLILALDVPTREEAVPMLRQLRGSLKWVKIGLQMFTAYGPDYVRAVADEGYNIFLDLKLHDIPNTVAKAVESLAPLPIGMLTLHTSGGREMMLSAQKAAAQTKPNLLLLGVTVLTSTNAAGLAETGINATPEGQVARLGRLGFLAGRNRILGSRSNPFRRKGLVLGQHGEGLAVPRVALQHGAQVPDRLVPVARAQQQASEVQAERHVVGHRVDGAAQAVQQGF